MTKFFMAYCHSTLSLEGQVCTRLLDGRNVAKTRSSEKRSAYYSEVGRRVNKFSSPRKENKLLVPISAPALNDFISLFLLPFLSPLIFLASSPLFFLSPFLPFFLRFKTSSFLPSLSRIFARDSYNHHISVSFFVYHFYLGD